MKTKVILIFSLVIFFHSGLFCQNGKDATLLFIQDSIYNEFLKSFEKGNIQGLDQIEQTLTNHNSPLSQYWLAYAQYYKSIYFLKMGNKKQSKKIVQDAIALLEKQESKDSEVLALLALMQSYYIQFTAGMDAGIISARVKENANESIKLDSNNIRGWYVLANNDYYTPKQFGGGKKAEEYLLKAISLPEQKLKNPIMPSWGKSDSYFLLISFYIDNEEMEKAKKIFIQAKELYPDNYMINQYAAKFQD